MSGKTAAVSIGAAIAGLLALASAWNGAIVAQNYASAEGVTTGEAGFLGATTIGAVVSGVFALVMKFWNPAPNTPQQRLKRLIEAGGALIDAGLFDQAQTLWTNITGNGAPPSGSIVLRWEGKTPWVFNWGPQPTVENPPPVQQVRG